MSLTLPPLERTALLLDMDGTLLDLAPTPGAVIVPPELPGVLRRLRDRLGGALAIITGRPIEQIDALLPGVPHAVAGEHGGAIRHAPGYLPERAPLPTPPEAWLTLAEAAIAAHPGALLERKQRGFVLHFRAVPAAGPALYAWAWQTVDARFQVLEASMAWEIRPRGVDKGVALRALMARPPFARRVPLFIGDDVTDEDAIRAAQALGGVGLRVDAWFGTPDGVRRWLASAAAAQAWPAL